MHTRRSCPSLLAGVVLGASLALGACGEPAPDGTGPEVPADPVEEMMTPGPEEIPEITCAGTPATGAKGPWRHSIQSPLSTAAGDPRHRGIDLIAGSTTAQQHLRGEISYGVVDKALHDEEVEVFGCRAGAWQKLGSTLTDDNGGFDLVLTSTGRLPVGQRPLYASVVGDRSGVGFLAVVLPAGSQLAVSDIDGTLTSSESAYPESILTGAMVAAHDGAPQAIAVLKSRRYRPVYLTSRGRYFTEPSRSWLKDRGFPIGPLRLAPSFLTFPGDATIDYKAGTMGEITAAGLSVQVGIGNRASDAAAYARVSVPAQQIFLKQPEYQSELDPVLARGAAVGFDSYRALATVLQALPVAP